MRKKKMNPMRIAASLCSLLGLSILSCASANAASVTFNFDTGQQTLGQFVTTGTVLTPDSGDTTQKITATDVGTRQPNSIQFVFGEFYNLDPINSNGLAIATGDGANDILQFTFRRPIYRLSFDFSVQSGLATPPANDPNAIQISALTAPGTGGTTIASASYAGGTYDSPSGGYQGFGAGLSSRLGFSTIQFSLLNRTGTFANDTFVIDDLVADDTPFADVPEPGAIALGLALGMPALWRLRKARKSRTK